MSILFEISKKLRLVMMFEKYQLYLNFQKFQKLSILVKLL